MYTIRVFYDRAGILGRVYGEEETQSYRSAEEVLAVVKTLLPMMRKDSGKVNNVSFRLTYDGDGRSVYVEMDNHSEQEGGVYTVTDEMPPSDGQIWTQRKRPAKMTAACVKKHIAAFLTENEKKEDAA